MTSPPVEAPAAGEPAAAPPFSVLALTRAQRLLRDVLRAVALGDLLAASWLLVVHFAGAYSSRPPPMVAELAGLALLAWLGAGLISWFARATLHVEPQRLVLERGGERLEIPRASVEAVRMWLLPLPGAGLSLRMKSGRDFQYGLRGADPLPLLEALGRQDAGAAAAARHPLAAFAHARATHVFRRVGLVAFKFGGFSLLPGTIMFQLNQRISYGGPFAQYQLYGLGPYLASFLIYWAYATAALVLLASVLRVPAELLACGGAWLSPPHARGVRRFVEAACALLYFVGFPALLVARILL